MLGRMASDAMLANEGAQYVEDQPGKPRLEATAEQVAEARNEMEYDLAGRARQEEAVQAIGLESDADARARLEEIAARTEKIKEELGRIELAVDLKNDEYVPRSQRPNAPAAGVQNFGDNRPARAQGKGYYAGAVPTTAPPIEKKKGFFKGLFGGN